MPSACARISLCACPSTLAPSTFFPVLIRDRVPVTQESISEAIRLTLSLGMQDLKSTSMSLFHVHATFVLHSCRVRVTSRREAVWQESAFPGAHQLLRQTPTSGGWKIEGYSMPLSYASQCNFPASSTPFSILLTDF